MLAAARGVGKRPMRTRERRRSGRELSRSRRSPRPPPSPTSGTTGGKDVGCRFCGVPCRNRPSRRSGQGPHGSGLPGPLPVPRGPRRPQPRGALTANDSAAQQFETAFPEYLIKAFGDEGADTIRTARSRGSWERLRREQAKAADATNGRHRPLGLRRKLQSNRRQNHKRGDGCNNILVIVVRDVVLRLLRRRPRRRRA